MILLVTTLCLAIGPDAECHKDVRYVSGGLEACKVIGRAYAQYLFEHNTDAKVLHLGFTCSTGKDI